jgi:hypothetical protein
MIMKTFDLHMVLSTWLTKKIKKEGNLFDEKYFT